MEKLKACIAEFIGTFALIFVGILAVLNSGGNNGGLLMVALAYGLTFAVMVSATGSLSGGHLNPAVTFGALIGSKISFSDAIRYWVSQIAGALVAGLVVGWLFKNSAGVVEAGTPALTIEGTQLGLFRCMFLEAIATFFLVFVVFGTGIDPRGPKIGGLAIGLTATIGILAIGSFTGGALNPARFFGPALSSGVLFSGGDYLINHLFLYWVGPLSGGGLAGFIYSRFLMKS